MVPAYARALSRLGERQRFGVKPGLERVQAALAELGHPERAARRIVHVAGTNGKGSTAAFVESVLRAAGMRTALYTSPHLRRFTERIRAEGRELGQAECAAALERALDCEAELTWFEAATVAAFLAFQARGEEVWVLEVGLGGRLDATNVIVPDVAVVTGIAMDHAEILGGTLPLIAREKAGIWKRGVPALFACEDDEAAAVLTARAHELEAPLYRLGHELHAVAGPTGFRYEGPGGALEVAALGLAGAHQRTNAVLALAACAFVDPNLADDVRARGLAQTRWPGRLERLDTPEGAVLLDCAHNPDGARALARALPDLAGGRPVTLLFGVAADKDARAMLDALTPLSRRVILTQPPSARARAPETLAHAGEVVEGPDAALARARSLARAEGGLVVVCGSIFLIGHVRGLLTGEPSDPPSPETGYLQQDPMGPHGSGSEKL